MNVLTSNKAVLFIFCSIDMNALTGNAQNHATRSIKSNIKKPLEVNTFKSLSNQPQKGLSFFQKGLSILLKRVIPFYPKERKGERDERKTATSKKQASHEIV
jgi:hypothetical protein